ncbi:hypothetical protein OPFAMLBM_00012 [Aeromonas phage avDM12-TAAL]|nr:hypothetical protein OPFAMLBM_00012 [Aeromonas phage avDM12-TAAL]
MIKVACFISPKAGCVWITSMVNYTKLSPEDALKRAKRREASSHGQVDIYLSQVLEFNDVYCTINEYQDVESVIRAVDAAGYRIIGFPAKKVIDR